MRRRSTSSSAFKDRFGRYQEKVIANRLRKTFRRRAKEKAKEKAKARAKEREIAR